MKLSALLAVTLLLASCEGKEEEEEDVDLENLVLAEDEVLDFAEEALITAEPQETPDAYP